MARAFREGLFLACIIIAGVCGGLTAKTSILLVQALPALLAIVIVYFASSDDGN